MVTVSSVQALQNVSRWSLAACWRWWWEGLLGWLPARVRRWLMGSARRLIIMPGVDKLALFRQEDGDPEALADQSWGR
ncbi:MAG: hypothetical protein H6975_09340 [Gammaproteobacteria bacterium]|nr:hypothetical protein [Gammaproteobacteria bacterium]